MADTGDQDTKAKVHELIKDVNFAMLVTRGPDDRMHARPMSTSKAEFDGTLWFFADIRSGKIRDLEADPKVLVTYADESDNAYVSITGRGSAVQDRAKIKELWSAGAKAWFPNGPEDPNVALIRVDVEDAEYWDSPSGTLVTLYGYAKSLATGKPPTEVAENKSVKL